MREQLLQSHFHQLFQLLEFLDNQILDQQYQFFVSYLVELVLTYLIYYPIEGLILFSGIVSCGIFGRLAITGGRPYEIKKLKEEQRRQDDDDDIEDQGIEVELEVGTTNI